MNSSGRVKFKSITEFHRLWGLPKPEHPLISVVDFSKARPQTIPESVVFGCYFISIKRNMEFKMIYGQQEYDFDEGVMFFIAPNQVLKIKKDHVLTVKPSGWGLLVHPDFFWNTPLAKTINRYDYFHYAANEALFLSEKEEITIENLIQNIQQEYHSNIDKFTQDIIISQIETLLNYSERFYQRQFMTRKKVNHSILDQMEEILLEYFNRDDIALIGLPTVQFLAEKLNLSPSYLTGVLKTLTGRSTQQHIQDKIIEKAKEKLSITSLTVSEIAYELGFEHPQSFNKLFKAKTKQSPLQFRHSFN
ncbi:helix-turn-helix domain-containing protein [Flexithrix dorotheae]|uniref:helix-turn-helix domain-containing protein n=1 Tax=Flexithrix dorotheae TaxID=70993 RepID=UPI00035EA3C8|nr:helix-turn-helix domain-containing protein [Flexithrix dorotheae]